ncbi:MAG TPA: hypothetical protein P5301_07440 [Bacteroidales bacterium]|nr:hypothetical protein [Bacteroidales bacterium]HNY76305.1 hypothetical protein [Bacteroidales bacterium]HOC40909.1 hypothetical protein [Bacteroidales bacterium]HOF07866.1 hypothetical protein [Bacteroidales bacterium]HOJ25116.1 hypothetical protein [Bacteroidales bacterium]
MKPNIGDMIFLMFIISLNKIVIYNDMSNNINNGFITINIEINIP